MCVHSSRIQSTHDFYYPTRLQHNGNYYTCPYYSQDHSFIEARLAEVMLR